MAKLKLALYWAGSCGGCEIAVLEIGERILKVIEIADIVFWPCVIDFKYKDVENMDDNEIDVTLFNGVIRNSENEDVAKLLRKKSKILIAYGSCANEGCIPALANFYTKSEIFEIVYKTTPSTINHNGVEPAERTEVAEGELDLPHFYDQVFTLAEVVNVDYYIPGCPPTADRTWECIELIAGGKLPPPGSVIGAGDKAVCDECDLVKEEKRISGFVRPHLYIPDGEHCLLEQGIVCMGPATRSGCGAQCLKANMPCRGCYGPIEGIRDQGAKMISAIGSLVDSTDPGRSEEIINQIVDPAGTFYRFGLAKSLMRRAKRS
ncbi:MAG: oxidoreductase [Fidelibacterota bacterium]